MIALWVFCGIVSIGLLACCFIALGSSIADSIDNPNIAGCVFAMIAVVVPIAATAAVIAGLIAYSQ